MSLRAAPGHARILFLMVLPMAPAWGHAPEIGLNKLYLNFVALPGGPDPAAQTVAMTNTTHGRMTYRAAAATAGGGAWLSVSPPSGALPGDFEGETVNLTLTAVSASLAAGVYYGTITISSPGDGLSPPASNSPQQVEVFLTVSASGQPAPSFGLSQSAISLEGVSSRQDASTSLIGITNLGGGSLSWTATASGGAWLSVSPASGVNAAAITVTARPTLLTPGSYTGQITLTASGAVNSPRVLPVSFRVRDPLPPALRVSTIVLNFTTFAGSPAPQRIAITNAGDGALAWRVSSVTFSGGTWLAVTPASGSAPGVVAVEATRGELTPGFYAGRITITADGAVSSPAQVAVNFTVQRPRPIFDRRGVVNAASYRPFNAPGALMSIFGSNLGPREGVAFTLDPDTGKLPTSLAGTSVTFDGVPAPLFYVSESQVNLQVPFEVSEAATMVVNVAGLDPSSLDLGISEAAPALFTLDGVRAAALNEDSTLNTPENAAPAGSVLQLFLTGQGAVIPRVATGALAPTAPPFPEPRLPVSVNIAGFTAKVLFAGLAPGFAGLMQINAEVPRAVSPSNTARVVVGIGPHLTISDATIAVR